ncbi:MAG: DUF2807 domain-containing protein [Burkholderiaceae bacterium]
MISEKRDVGAFRNLKLSTGARVVIRQGKDYSVEVEAEEDVLPMLETYVEDGTLVVEDVKHFKSPSAVVVITIRGVAHIGTTGSVAVLAEELSLPTLALSMGGTSAMHLRNSSIAKLNAALGGSSVFKVSGAAGDFSLNLGGSSSVRAAELAAKRVSVTGGGSSQAVVWASESLGIALGGSAGVSYYGAARPAQVTSGSATVKFLGSTPSEPR